VLAGVLAEVTHCQPLSCCCLFGAAQDTPRHIWAQVFAAHAGKRLYSRAIFSRNLPRAIPPK